MNPIPTMMFDALTESRKFRDALIRELRATPLADFEPGWGKNQLPDRTEYYKEKLLPRVAASCGYQFQPEFLLVDHSFLNSDRVPVVFIESEHSHPTIGREIDRLCAVSSPVKVLLLSCEWADGVRELVLPHWKARIAAGHNYLSQPAVYIMVIGQWERGKHMVDWTLRYYIESFNTSGNEIDLKVVELESRRRNKGSVLGQEKSGWHPRKSRGCASRRDLNACA